MTPETEQLIRDYLHGWSDEDFKAVDDLHNDGMPLIEALLTVDRVKSAPGSVRLEVIRPSIPTPSEETLLLPFA